MKSCLIKFASLSDPSSQIEYGQHSKIIEAQDAESAQEIAIDEIEAMGMCHGEIIELREIRFGANV